MGIGKPYKIRRKGFKSSFSTSDSETGLIKISFPISETTEKLR